jgi:dimethylargininase
MILAFFSTSLAPKVSSVLSHEACVPLVHANRFGNGLWNHLKSRYPGQRGHYFVTFRDTVSVHKKKVTAIAPISSTKFRQMYTIALARQLPDCFADAMSMNTNPQRAVNMKVAKAQHQEYIQALRMCIPVLELPAVSPIVIETDDKDGIPETKYFPDCVFVEDTVVAIGQYALVTRMGHPARRGEEKHIYEVLKQLGMNVINMNDYQDSVEWVHGATAPGAVAAKVDGGDVLHTGRHIFVGLSNRTNIEGATFIKHYFTSYDVVILPQLNLLRAANRQTPLHLKSVVTHIDEGTLLAPVGPIGDLFLDAMRVEQLDYKVYRLPDALSCNVVACNGQVIVQNTSCQKSQRILHEAVMETDHDLICVNTSELAKKDGALTCCSVLLEA